MSYQRALLPVGLIAANVVGACESGNDSTRPAAASGGGAGAPLGTGGDGGAAGAGTGGDTVDPDPNQPPQWLSETGLYAADGVTLAEGVEPFEPRFPLWTDGAAKRRWIALPAGGTIDTSDPDRWAFPAGTRLWKEFTRDDVRVETRLLERRPDGSWWMIAYQWNAEQTDAEARPDGVLDASGTDHDIPSRDDCRTCHSQSSARVLGFGALQLTHDGDGLTLDQLVDRGLLSAPPESIPDLPGTPAEQAILGALHANCGHCHQPTSNVNGRTGLQLWLPLDQLGSLQDTPFHLTTVDVGVDLPAESPEGTTLRIDPGSPETSALFLRLSSRGTDYEMPPLGTEVPDDALVDALEEWIADLEP